MNEGNQTSGRTASTPSPDLPSYPLLEQANEQLTNIAALGLEREQLQSQERFNELVFAYIELNREVQDEYALSTKMQEKMQSGVADIETSVAEAVQPNAEFRALDMALEKLEKIKWNLFDRSSRDDARLLTAYEREWDKDVEATWRLERKGAWKVEWLESVITDKSNDAAVIREESKTLQNSNVPPEERTAAIRRLAELEIGTPQSPGGRIRQCEATLDQATNNLLGTIEYMMADFNDRALQAQSSQEKSQWHARIDETKRLKSILLKERASELQARVAHKEAFASRLREDSPQVAIVSKEIFLGRMMHLRALLKYGR